MTSLVELKKTLKEVTGTADPAGFFLEHSQSREMSYSMQSACRWLDVVQKIEVLNIRGKLLDIGTSPLTFALQKRFADVETLDYTNAFQQRCELYGIKLHVGGDNWAQNATVPDDYYDCITFLEVIEHMHVNPEQTLLYLRAKLRKNGCLILSTPNLMCFGNRIRMLMNRKLSHVSYPAFADNEHYAHGHMHDRVYMPAEMEDYLKNTGWSSYQIGYQGLDAADDDTGVSMTRRLLRSPIRLLKRIDPSLRQLMMITAWK
jgi:2-polyprenyl-3-methyl-5-hydroxy-6-metoxy-1,4-benzoquinol methylase